MTREEAIKKLKKQRNVTCNGCLHAVGWCESHCKFSEAIDMAIEALEQPTSFNTIDQQAAIDICNAAIDFWYGMLGEGALVAVRDKISGLPPARPEPQEGAWIIEKDESGVTRGRCPKCGMVQYAGYTNFCPDCGAKLKGGAR